MINQFTCSGCGFETQVREGMEHYAVADDGAKKGLDPENEESAAKALTGKTMAQLASDGRLGVWVEALCMECMATVMTDREDEPKKCPQCGGENLTASYEMEGAPCPKCGQGSLCSDEGDMFI
ncbi:MAG: hypothetical protein OEZ04_05200, partial [Nitrospinota bacterium]|nr:hypothetical protein [Nitrospinota bacterium]